MLCLDIFKFNCDLFIRLNISTQIDLSEGSTADLATETKLVPHAGLHGETEESENETLTLENRIEKKKRRRNINKKKKKRSFGIHCCCGGMDGEDRSRKNMGSRKTIGRGRRLGFGGNRRGFEREILTECDGEETCRRK
eukprot:TRINITY_DN988_c1_g4_i2.p1 TRINITY_DN988_c1_g4~~TRINITY_DN988_c1_g4_i2.p1  ORF type:complete len:139 (-),score=21.30 TRINITY_DN988_c1_g4_i2:248-664(-)